MKNNNINNDFYLRRLPVLSTVLLSLSILFYVYSFSYGVLTCLVGMAFLLCLFKDEVASSMGIFLLANNTILAIAFFMHDGIVSYLWNGQFDQYYIKVLFLESIFWGIFIIGCGKTSSVSSINTILNKKNSFLMVSSIIFLIIGIPFLIADIIISSSSYFISYVEFSSTGTVAYETGAAFVAFAVFLRIGKKVPRYHLLLELLAVLLILYIAIGSGKRLPLAYPIFAYTVWISYTYSRLLAGFVYFGIALSGYIFGIVRDAMVLQSPSADVLLSGLKYTNQGATLHASAVYVRIVDENLISTTDQLISFASNIFLAIFMSLSALPDVARINEYAMSYYDVQGNGGVIGAYSYFFLDWIGPFILPLLLVWMFRSRGATAALAFGFVAVMSPRWTLYNIGPAMRVLGLVAGMIFLLVIFDVRRFTSRRNFSRNMS